jgi:tetratricopeptide (TPR) repeat protein
MVRKLEAQEEALDSLDRLLYRNLNHVERIRIRSRIAIEYIGIDRKKALSLLDQVIEEARESNLEEELAIGLSNKGYILNIDGEFASALKCYLEAHAIYTSLGNYIETGFLCYRVGLVYKNLGDYLKATEFCMEGLRIFESNGRNDGLALIYRILGSIFKYQGDIDKSLYYYFSGLELNEETGNSQGIANSYNNIGVVYFMGGEFEKALSYYQRSLEINLEINSINEAAINYGNIGSVYLEYGRRDSALHYFQKKYDAAIKINSRRTRVTAMESFGNYYFTLGDFQEAIRYYYEALELSRVIGTLENTKSILENLSDLYMEISDFENALSAYSSYVAVKDSLMNNEVLQRISQLEMEYEFEKEMDYLKLKEERRKLHMLLFISIFLISTLFLLLLFMSTRVKLKRRRLDQKKLEMDKKQLLDEIYFKNRELTSKAIFVAEKNELITEMISRLNKLLYSSGEKSAAIKEIIKELKVHSNLKVWDEFEYVFVQVHPDFFETLGSRFPDLTPNEKRLAALLRLNLSTKDISNITHQSAHSITVARTRLRKKLGIVNTSENLVTFLSQF